MRRMALLAAALVAVTLLTSRGSPYRHVTCQEKTTAQWEAELRKWELVSDHVHPKDGHSVGWSLRRPLWDVLYEKVSGQTLWKNYAHWVQAIAGLGGFSLPRSPVMEDPEAIPVLVELLRSPHVSVQRVALHAIERFRDRGRAAVPALLEALKSGNPDVCKDVEHALWQVDEEAARQAGILHRPGVVWKIHLMRGKQRCQN